MFPSVGESCSLVEAGTETMAIKAFKLCCERAVIFTFLSWKQGRKEKGGRERDREVMCVFTGEEEMQREVLNMETMLTVNGSPC